MKKYKKADDIPDNEVPINFDWTDIKGVDYTNKPRHQGVCGSCYA